MRAEAAWRTPPWTGPPLARLHPPAPFKQAPGSCPCLSPSPPCPPLLHVPLLPNAPALFSCLAPIPPSTVCPGLSAGSARGPHPASLHADLQTGTFTLVHAHTRPSIYPLHPAAAARRQGQCLPHLCPQHTGTPGHSWEGHCPGNRVGENPSCSGAGHHTSGRAARPAGEPRARPLPYPPGTQATSTAWIGPQAALMDTGWVFPAESSGSCQQP